MQNHFNICPICEQIPDKPGPCDCVNQKRKNVAKRQAGAFRDMECREELDNDTL